MTVKKSEMVLGWVALLLTGTVLVSLVYVLMFRLPSEGEVSSTEIAPIESEEELAPSSNQDRWITWEEVIIIFLL